MILETQPILGWGSRRAEDINMLGVSTTTRFLYSVLSGKVYAGKKKDHAPLHKLINSFAEHIGNCFSEAIAVKGIWTKKLFLVCLGCKGGLQAFIKIGKLQRHFLRDTPSGVGKGICHLCLAGTQGHSWHFTGFKAMQNMKVNLPDPWDSEPSLISKIPQSPTHKPEFFRLDIFHTLLKGVFADMAANAIVAPVCVHNSCLENLVNPNPALVS